VTASSPGPDERVFVPISPEAGRIALGLLRQQQGRRMSEEAILPEEEIGPLVENCVRLYEALWRMQSDGASFYVDNIRTPLEAEEVRAQKLIVDARARSRRRVLLPFKVR